MAGGCDQAHPAFERIHQGVAAGLRQEQVAGHPKRFARRLAVESRRHAVDPFRLEGRRQAVPPGVGGGSGRGLIVHGQGGAHCSSLQNR